MDASGRTCEGKYIWAECYHFAMKRNLHRLILPALLAAWMAVAWPHVSEQYSRAARARAALASLSWEERTAALDRPGYQIAREIAAAVPSRGCVQILMQAGPEHSRYYRARLPYYLYPRRMRFPDRIDAPEGRCGYVAVFRDLPQNLVREPFQGHWDERELAERTSRMKKIFSGERLEIFQE
jgi:hypothetical protein